MNQRKTTYELLAISFVIASFVAFPSTLSASGNKKLTTRTAVQCVTCGIEGGCFICVADPCCAKKCRTIGCASCLATEPCPAGGAPISFTQDEKKKFSLKFDEDSLRQIAAVAPRFAATLANFNKLGGLTDTYAKVTWANVPLDPQDIEWWLKPEKESTDFFSKLDRQARKANLSNKPLIVYELKVSEVSRAPIVTLDVLNGSGIDEHQSLIIHMVDGATAAAQTEQQKRTVARWEIK